MGEDTADWWREDGNTGDTTHKTDQLIFRNKETSVLNSTPSVFDFRDRRILAVWRYGNKWREIVNVRFFKAALLTQAVPPWMKNVRGWQIIFQLPSYNAGSHTWAESGAHAGKYGAEDDRMESVNQRGPWWPERTAGLPELMARWREHRYLSHYHSRWWTQASLQTPHPWQMKNSPFVNGALRESSGWVRVRFGFESWCFSASMAVLTGGRSKVAIILFRDSSPSLHCCRMQQRSCMPTHPD